VKEERKMGKFTVQQPVKRRSVL